MVNLEEMIISIELDIWTELEELPDHRGKKKLNNMPVLMTSEMLDMQMKPIFEAEKTRDFSLIQAIST